MAEGSAQAWNEVEERFAAWGKHVSQRYRREDKAKDDEADAEAQRKLDEAAREIVDQLGRAFSAVGDTLKDDEAKRDLREAVSALAAAIGTTVSEAGDAIRRGARPSAAPGPAPDAPRPDAPTTDAPTTDDGTPADG
jgi:vacuolar-type H+-ATPase subunit E/Vma4